MGIESGLRVRVGAPFLLTRVAPSLGLGLRHESTPIVFQVAAAMTVIQVAMIVIGSGVGPSDHACDVSKLLPRSPVAIIGTAKRSGAVTKDAPGMNYVCDSHCVSVPLRVTV